MNKDNMLAEHLLASALKLAECGYPVFPLSPFSKIPLPGSKGLKDATQNIETIRKWWEATPLANIGVRTGDGVVVIDVDSKSGGMESLAKLEAEHGKLNETGLVFTGGGGRHYWCLSYGTRRNTQGLFPGIDIRGDGGYVVAPPSIHESGGVYEWALDGASPGGLLPPQELPALPEWARQKVEPPVGGAKPAAAAGLKDGERGQLSRHTLSFIATGAKPGEWHAAFYKAAIDIRQQGYDIDEARGMLVKVTGHLDDTDEKQLLDVYTKRTPKHPPRLPLPVNEPPTVISRSQTGYAGLEELYEGVPPRKAEESLVIDARSLIGESMSYLANKDVVTGQPTFLPGLDALLGGGKRLGELTALCAEAKVGKSSLLHQLIYLQLQAGIGIGYASRELTPSSEVIPNILSICTQKNVYKEDITEELRQKYEAIVAPWPLYFAKGYGVFELPAITSWVEELVAKGVKYFVIDHLHYCLLDSEDFKAAAAFTRALKTLAKEKNVHIDLVTQPTKIGENVKMGLNALRGGAAIGQAIDNLLIMERVKGEGMPRNLSKLTLEVGRSKLARPGSIYLSYNPETTTLTEVELEEVERPSPPPTLYNQNVPLYSPLVASTISARRGFPQI